MAPRAAPTLSLRTVAAAVVAAFTLGGCSLRELGRHIPQPEIERDYLLAVGWGALLLLSILYWPVPKGDKRPLVLVWLAKLGVTLGAMLFYEHNYGLDAYFYFAEPNEPGFRWRGFSLGDGTQNILMLSWLHQKVVPDSYHALKVSCAMLGMLGIYIFYRALVAYRGVEDVRIFYGLSLFPSILFWGSILGKDPIALLGICLYAYGVVKWYRSGRLVYLPLIVVGVAVAMIIRAWMGVILLAPLSVFALLRMRRAGARAVFVALVMGGLLFALSNFQDQFQVESSEDLYLTTHTVSRSWAYGGSAQEIGTDFDSLGSMVLFLPLGAFTAIYRPLPGEVLNVFGTFAGLENLVLLLATWVAFRRTSLRDLRDPLVLWAVLLVAVWAAAYGFVSYQNLGSGVRFRLQVMPFLLVLLMHLGRRRAPAPLPAAQEALKILGGEARS